MPESLDCKAVDKNYRLKCIQALSEAGFCLFPVAGKIPVVKDWPAVAPGAYGAHNLTGNYGIALKPGDLVIDVDPRNFKQSEKDPFLKLVEDCGLAEITGSSFIVKTGGGGMHIYLSKPSDVKVKKHHKDYKGIDFLTAGAYIVGPGSIHPDTGRVYEVADGHPKAIAAAPSLLLSILEKAAAHIEDLGAEIPAAAAEAVDEGTQKRFTTYLKEVAPLAKAGQNGDDTTFKVCCNGRDLGLSKEVTLELLEKDWNPRCEPPWTHEELKFKVANAYRYATGAQGAKHPAADFKDAPPADTAAEPGAESSEDTKAEPLDWRQNKTDGKALKCLHNLLIYLRLPNSGLDKVFGYNEFTGQIEVTRPAPWHNGKMPRHPGIVDHDLKLLKAHLSKRYEFEVPVSIVEEGITVTSYENRFHPVREYLQGLVWDGKPRLDNWLIDYTGAQDNPYTRACSRKTLCAAVARVFHPGVKFDHILVLEGDQGTGKSWLCAALGGEWSGDFVIDPHNKDTVQALQGKWIVEMSEMEVTRRSDANALKAFISRQTDKARLAYQRLSSEFPRQCIFIGTINPEADGTWLKDDTGNRRFWPVATHGRIDVAGVKKVRNQLFAEAVQVLKGGEKLFMENAALNELAQLEAAGRHAEHPWTEQIVNWLSGPEVLKRDFITAREIFIEAMGGMDKQFGTKESKSVATVMRQQNWVKTVKHIPNRGAVRGYSRPVPVRSVAEIESELGDLI